MLFYNKMWRFRFLGDPGDYKQTNRVILFSLNVWLRFEGHQRAVTSSSTYLCRPVLDTTP